MRNSPSRGAARRFAQALERLENAKGIYVSGGYGFMVTLIDKQIDLLNNAKAANP